MIEGRDFLDVAVYLEAMDGEASARSRTGRAYYAAFLEARSYGETHLGYVRTKSGRQHVLVPRLFSEIDPDIEADLAFLRKLRNIADYEIYVSMDTIAAQSILAKEFAHRILARLDRLSKKSTGSLATSESLINDDDRPIPE